ncbi:hypothetical protein [Ekhidna sp.]|uniref:hypothetical protein n=1 Tax=Ekhidna sp. TaxID=2608089 RepID=UPI003C7A1683
MKTFKVRQLALIFSLLFIACQEDSIVESDELDQDMIAASELADEYLKSEKGRFEDSDKSITVLKYTDGKLMFDTNTDDFKGYQEVEETSVTAVVEPGDYIFWFAGIGLSEVDEIDFDEPSQEILGDLPVDFIPQKMWIIRIPPNTTQNSLKYDIVYVPEGSNTSIRLDPKIKVGGQDDESGEGE